MLEDDDVLTLSLGPQHPSTHGVLRLILQLQGETVVGADVEMGWLHRSTEKLGEARPSVTHRMFISTPGAQK